jgi:UDP-N-acetylmuramate--alanine ligase
VLNSLAAVAVGLDLGVPFAAVKEGLESFTGVDRRFQVRGTAGGITVIDDYGHHPTEIRATLETLRGLAGTRRTVVLFQPHRYTRTLHLWDDFCRAFHLADLVLIADIYPAGEEPIEGISSETLAAAISGKGHRQVIYGGELRAAVDRLVREVREGDVVLTLGAGSVWTAGDELLRRRAEADPAGGGTT